MITFYDRQYNVIAQATFASLGGLVAYDDEFEKDLDTGLSTYTFTIDKIDKDIENAGIGNYVRAVDISGNKYWFEVMDTAEDNDLKTFVCVDAGLDLIGESVYPYDADKSYPISFYLAKFMLDSGWETDLSEVGDTHTRKLKYESFETASKRIRQVARAFGYEIEYDIVEVKGAPSRKIIRFKKSVGHDKGVRLEYGREISKIKKTSSIQKLATALRARGADGLTLNGYRYNDGRYWVGGDTIHDLQEGARWSRHKYIVNDGGYIVDTYESEAKTQETLFQETLRQLKKRAYPEIEYEVEFSELPEEVEIGDWVIVVDYDYKPALKIRARVTKIVKSLSQGIYSEGKVVISNIEIQESSVDEKIKQLEKFLKEQTFDFNKVPVMMNITSSNGTVFTTEGKTTLKATITKLGIDITENYELKWIRDSKDSNKDSEYNNGTHNGNTLEVSNSDVNFESTFYCEAYQGGAKVLTDSIVLKSILIKKSIGAVPPQNPQSGDLWTDTSNPQKEVVKVFVNNEWKPVISDATANIEKITKEWETNNRDYAERFTELTREIETVKEYEANTRDLTGKFGDMEKAYKKILEQERTIEALGQRQKSLELNLEQSSAVLKAVDRYFDFSRDGLVLGKNGDGMQMRLANDRLEFIDGGKLTAFMTGQKVTILSGVFWENITIGNHIFEKFGNEFTFISYVGENQ